MERNIINVELKLPDFISSNIELLIANEVIDSTDAVKALVLILPMVLMGRDGSSENHRKLVLNNADAFIKYGYWNKETVYGLMLWIETSQKNRDQNVKDLEAKIA